ncbi:MAG: VgrG-related protein [Spirulina sp. SIO3F2]|nr:VgrG-related protein [Spirulina sp. SIO3F2]
MSSYRPDFSLKIDGSDASDALMQDILQVSVEESLNLPCMCTLIIRNTERSGRDDDAFWQHESLFTVGKSIEVSFTSSTTADSEFDTAITGTLFKGEITALETQFTGGSQAPIIIRAYDVSHRLHRGRTVRTFQNMTDSDIVKKIIGELGITSGTVSTTSPTHDYVCQENQTNMEFLRMRAARNGYLLYVQDEKLYFQAPTSSATVELTWRKNLYDFRVRVSSAEQISEVEVRGWDYTKKAEISSSKTSQSKVVTSTDHGEGKSKATAFTKPTSAKVLVPDRPIASSSEADTIAQALFDELSGEFVIADGRADGNPDIRPGKAVKVSDMSTYSGTYFVTETRHIYADNTYSTEFNVRGSRGGNLLSVLSPPTRLRPGQTFLIGKVTDNSSDEDPSPARVKVWFPSLTPEEGEDAHTSWWARVVAPGAGSSRGLHCLPEVGDEVLVGFEHGDIHRPLVLGGLWNGTDKTPEKIADAVVANTGVRLRTFKTRLGHTVQFVEEDKDSSYQGIYLTTAGGAHAHFNDTADKKYIEIKTIDGHTLKFDDKEEQVKLTTKGGHSALFDDKNSKIEVSSSGGHSLKMDDSGKKISITSSGDIDISTASGKTMNLSAGTINATGTTGVNLKVSSNKLAISSSSVSLESSLSMTVKGLTTKIEGSTSVTVSSLSIKLG